jgi:hypothetical protein
MKLKTFNCWFAKASLLIATAFGIALNPSVSYADELDDWLALTETPATTTAASPAESDPYGDWDYDGLFNLMSAISTLQTQKIGTQTIMDGHTMKIYSRRPVEVIHPIQSILSLVWLQW